MSIRDRKPARTLVTRQAIHQCAVIHWEPVPHPKNTTQKKEKPPGPPCGYCGRDRDYDNLCPNQRAVDHLTFKGDDRYECTSCFNCTRCDPTCMEPCESKMKFKQRCKKNPEVSAKQKAKVENGKTI